MSDDKENPINRALNLVPYEEKAGGLQQIVSKIHDDSAREDFVFARANIREVIENSTCAIIELAQISSQSQNPRAFEVLAKLMDTTVAANKQLLDLQKQIREIDDAKQPHSEEGKVINNNLFVGSTADLARVINDLKAKE